MAAAATRTYSNNGILPAEMPENAKPDSYVLAPGTYAKGTVIGQFSTLTNQADVQTITVSGTPNAGSFRLSFYGQVTAAIAYNAAAADVQTALEALSSIGTGNVTCTGGPFPGSTVVCTFAGDLTNRWQPLMLLYSNSLTGGSAPTASIAHTTPGRAAFGLFGPYDDNASNGLEVAKAIVQFDTEVDPTGNHKAGGGEWGQGVQKSAPCWVRGIFKTKEMTGIDANACADLGRVIKGNTSALTSDVTLLAINC